MDTTSMITRGSEPTYSARASILSANQRSLSTEASGIAMLLYEVM